MFEEEKTPDTMKALEGNAIYLSFMHEYSQFSEITLSGGHGATARFWMGYVKLVQQHLMFLRACKTNNFDLFVFTLGQMCYLFLLVAILIMPGGW